MAQERRFFKKSDIAVILSVILAALLYILWTTLGNADKSGVAQIYVDGTLWQTIELAAVEEPYLIELDAALHVHIEVSPGSIRFVQSECRDKICINTGVLSKASDYAACLPARVAVKVVSGDSAPALDGIVG